MLSHGLWRRRYGADPDIVGRTIQVDGVAHEVVGVLPPRLPAAAARRGVPVVTDADLCAPLQFDYSQQLPPRNLTFFTVFGRIKPRRDAGPGAGGDGSESRRSSAQEFPEHQAARRCGSGPSRCRTTSSSTPGPALRHCCSAPSALVLLIACANVANLLLARGDRAAPASSPSAPRSAPAAGR